MIKLSLDEALKKGIDAHVAGKFSEAESFYSAILKVNPNHAQTCYKMGMLKTDMGDLEGSVKFLKVAFRMSPKNSQYCRNYVEALFGLGRDSDVKVILLEAKKQGMKKKALKKIKQSLKAYPRKRIKNFDQFRTLPNHEIKILSELYASGKFQDLLDHGKKLELLFPESSVLYNIMGTTSISEKSFAMAVVYFEKAIEINNSDAEAYNNMGVAQNYKHDYDAAITSFRRAIEIKPDYAQAYFNMGNSYHSKGLCDESVNCYRTAIKIKPDHYNAAFNLGVVYQANQDFASAKRSYEIVLEYKADYFRAHLNIGIILFDSNMLEEALSRFKQVLEFKPDCSLACNYLGKIFFLKGEKELALSHFEKTLEISPEFFEANFNIGNIYRDRGDFTKAISYYENSVRTGNQSAEVFNNIGISYHHSGEIKTAIRNYEKAIEIKPKFAAFYNNIGTAFFDYGDLENALKNFELALEIDPNFAECQNNLGNLNSKKGNFSKATYHYIKACQLRPKYLEAFLNLETMLIQTDNKKVESLSEFVSVDEKFEKSLNLTPKHVVNMAISCFLEGKVEVAKKYLDLYVEAKNTFGILKHSPEDKIFCDAYFTFLRKLTARPIQALKNKATNIFHIGESHCLSYAHSTLYSGKKCFYICPTIIFGAKAYHFSQDGLNGFKSLAFQKLKDIPKNSKVLISVGEIDCRLKEGLLTASQKKGIDLKQLTEKTVSGYINWFVQSNERSAHKFYFFNIPAPVYSSKMSFDDNKKVANVVRLFNMVLQQSTSKESLGLIDVYEPSTNEDGFSNNLYHLDNRHLGQDILSLVHRQLEVLDFFS